MDRVLQETRTVETSDNRASVPVRRSPVWTIARVVWLITAVLESLLAFRFLLSLLGANRENAFANIIYSITTPFVAPFFSLFNYHPQYGVSRFEIETIVAMLVYLFIAWLIVRVITITKRTDTTVE